MLRRLSRCFALLSITGLAPLLFAWASAASAQTFDASLFYADEVGDFWDYRVNGIQNSTIEVVGSEFLEGVPTTLSIWTGGPYHGIQSNGSFDSIVGARLWEAFNPALFVDGVGFVSQLQEYDPPLVIARPTITIGEIVTSESPNFVQTFVTDSAVVVQPGTITAQYRYALIESVSVPFGTFDAIQVQIQLDLALEVSPGVINTARATQRSWIVPGLGLVKFESTIEDDMDVFELTNTNREFVPEPSVGWMLVAGVVALVGLARMRRQYA